MNEEQDIAAKLKEKCYLNGREKDPRETAELFYQLGVIYSQKHNKINLIQSAALFNAASARSSNDDTKAGIRYHLIQLCRSVLERANANDTDGNHLLNLAVDIKNELKVMREHTKQKISEMEQIPNDVPGVQLHQYEKRKIDCVQSIQAFVTNEFIRIMRLLSDKIVGILGQPPFPCQFSLVGLGSLARNEVTPFSDFECIFVLEEGINNNKEHYQNVLEHFRWFAVVYHIVLINLGETILPSVAIPSLNDFCEPDGDWFYDDFTPAGVCFDGLMPYACKTPLGRPQTLKKQYETELIKPVTDMVKYLDSEFDLKDGYHLAEVLSKICYVSGSNDVYQKFSECVDTKMRANWRNSENFYWRSLKKTISDDRNKFDIKENLNKVFFDGTIDIKRLLYRSVTLFVSHLGRLCMLKSPSGFEIIDELYKEKTISQAEGHKLRYAVAVACEIRLQVYMERERSSNTVSHNKHLRHAKNVADYVGLKSTTDALIIADNLQKYVSKMAIMRRDGLNSQPQLSGVDRLEVFSNKSDDSNVLQLNILYCLNHYDKCVEFALKYFNSVVDKDLEEPSKILHYRTCHACSLFQLGRQAEALEQFHELRMFLTNLDTPNQSSDNYQTELYLFAIYHCGLCCYTLKMYQDAQACFEEEMSRRESLAFDRNYFKTNQSSGYFRGLCLSKLKLYHDAIDQFDKSYETSIETEKTNIVYCNSVTIPTLFEKSKCLMKLKRYEEAFKDFIKVSEMQRKRSSNETYDFEFSHTLYYLGKCCYYLKQYSEALDYFNQVLDILNKLQANEGSQAVASKCQQYRGFTFFRLKDYNKAQECFLLHWNSSCY